MIGCDDQPRGRGAGFNFFQFLPRPLTKTVCFFASGLCSSAAPSAAARCALRRWFFNDRLLYAILSPSYSFYDCFSPLTILSYCIKLKTSIHSKKEIKFQGAALCQ